MFNLQNYWSFLLKDEWQKNYWRTLKEFLLKEYETKTVYPAKEDIFNALKLVDYFDCKVLILGQDPYHGENQADGLAFSVPYNVKIPPSLKNIIKETISDLNINQPKNKGNLICWAKQGVLLLNATLTVNKAQPNSHSRIGWQILTDKIISLLNKREKPIVFLLWGKYAQKKRSLINNKLHYILTAAHPSPLSANKGFFNCKHFSKTNVFLTKTKQVPIDWNLY